MTLKSPSSSVQMVLSLRLVNIHTGTHLAHPAKFGIHQKWRSVSVSELFNFTKNISLTISCAARQCLGEPPDPFIDMDRVWPLSNRDLGSNITYVCPYRMGTFMEQLKGKTFSILFSSW